MCVNALVQQCYSGKEAEGCVSRVIRAGTTSRRVSLAASLTLVLSTSFFGVVRHLQDYLPISPMGAFLVCLR